MPGQEAKGLGIAMSTALIFAQDSDGGDEQRKNEDGQKNEKVDIGAI